MADENPVIRSLRTAVEAAPRDVTLRLHLAELLLNDGRGNDAIAEIATALQQEPESTEARTLMSRAMTAPVEPAEPTEPTDRHATAGASAEGAGSPADPRSASGEEDPEVPAWDVEASQVMLCDVGGMGDVKKRLEASFLAPMRNPKLREMYGKNMRGGLLLYGPPGCGKTFIARAVAGELGASFVSVMINDVLDVWMGRSERNLHEIFETARSNAPCVVFFDELDALGAKRSSMRHNSMRVTVNQLLTELDGVDGSANDNVFVLGATNQPWEVDPALRRPGRFDRTVLVLPPDRQARESILGYHLQEKPVEDVDPKALAKRTEGMSGADLKQICEAAAERALLDSVQTGQARGIGMADLVSALEDTRPSIDPWMDQAKNVVMFANEGGVYDDLLKYLRRTKRL